MTALEDTMRFLSRLFASTTTTVTETYTIADVPGVPATMPKPGSKFRPEVLAVEYRDGRFHEVRVSGPVVGHPTIRVTRHYNRHRDLPEWARVYARFSNAY